MSDSHATQSKGGWDFHCPVEDGTCGADGVPFSSTSSPTRAIADARGTSTSTSTRVRVRPRTGTVRADNKIESV